jgi:hypothetical protein
MTKLLIAYSLAQALTDRAFVTFGLIEALLLAGLTWWLCGYSMWLWNRRFKMRLIHHVFCALAAAVTLVSIFFFQCLGELKNHALTDLRNWQQAYISDSDYGWKTFLRASDSLQELYRDNGWSWDSNTYLKPPREMPFNPSKYVLPADRQEARETSLKIYCDRAIENLALNRPVLSQILWKNSQIDMKPLREDLADFQRDHLGGTYDLNAGSLRIAGELCMEKLKQEVANQVFYLRSAMIGIFLLAQFLAFGLASAAAYSDIKIRI